MDKIDKKTKSKDYYLRNKERILEQGRVYYKKNRQAKIAYSKAYALKNRQQVLDKKKTYNAANKDKTKEYYINNKGRILSLLNDRVKKRRKNDINFRIASNLRTRLCRAIDANYKTGSAVSDLGCSVAELKSYLEDRFQEGMSWDNWGVNGWHIDHVIPLSSFDLTNKDEFNKACHYTNLYPLWAVDNRRKSNTTGV